MILCEMALTETNVENQCNKIKLDPFFYENTELRKTYSG